MEMIELCHSDVLAMLPDRDIHAHKGSFGRILFLCGSIGYTGAAALSAMAALRAGAGLVYLGVPESIYQIEATKLLEPIVFPLPEEHGRFSRSAIDTLKNMVFNMDAVLVGPGMGVSDGTFAITEWILNNASCPVVLDADGINILCDHKDILRGRTYPTILTPHTGEFNRFIGEVCTDKTEQTVKLAKDLGVIIAHKGNATVVSDGERVYINKTGNPGMAVGGSGDVLAGVITALIGQGIDPLNATAAGVWLHGAAGDICAQEIGQYGMLPSDMLTALPRLLK